MRYIGHKWKLDKCVNSYFPRAGQPIHGVNWDLKQKERVHVFTASIHIPGRRAHMDSLLTKLNARALLLLQNPPKHKQHSKNSLMWFPVHTRGEHVSNFLSNYFFLLNLYLGKASTNITFLPNTMNRMYAGAFNTKRTISNSCTHVESLKSCLLTTLVIIHLKIPLCLVTQEWL